MAPGSHIYEYGDHGAIIVVADDRRASTEVHYSWDEAMTWNELRFSETPTEIENIVIEPRATSQVFVMYGTRGEQGVLFQADFSYLHEPKCKGVDMAGDPSSDYELWSPSDGRPDGTKCLLGHQTRYTRRRRAAACFNGEEYERAEFRKNCPCAEDDYECDYGYERASDGGPCVAIMAVSSAPPQECRGTYTVSSGYRLVAGDTCDPSGGVDRLPSPSRARASSAARRRRSRRRWGVLFVLLLLLGVLAWVTLRNRRGERQGLNDLLQLLPASPADALALLGRLPALLLALPSLVASWRDGYNANRAARYGRVPDSADDELDLGDEEMLMDEEAEELRDDQFYDEGGRLGTLPPHTPQKEGSLLGEEFTSPHSVKKGD